MEEAACNGKGLEAYPLLEDQQSYSKVQGNHCQMETGRTGFLVSWGSGEFGQHGHADLKCPVEFIDGHFKDKTIQGRVKLAACGSSHSIVVTDTDEIFTWGNGTTGQLACPDWGSHLTPFKVNLEPPPTDDIAVTHVACGSRHTMVLLSNGQVHAFGNNFFAQLGYDFRKENYKENQSEPKPLSFLDHWQVVQVACGDKHSMVLFQDGTVAVFGTNTNGQIGDGTRVESVVPKPVDLDAKVKDIACGSNHSLVLTDNGDVYVWGYSKACGHRRHDVLSPQLKMQGRDVVQVAGGGTHSIALTASGRIYSWGFGLDGQLGLGDAILTTAQPRLIRHQKLCGRVSFVACAEGYSVAVTAQGYLYIWGKNSHVICASEPANTPYFYPVCVNPDDGGQQMTSVHSVYCGTWHLLALAGIPDRQPPAADKDNDDIFDESDEEEDEDDGMSSDGSTVHSRRGSVGCQSAAGSSGRPEVLSGLPNTTKGPADGSESTSGTHPFAVSKTTRVPTKLTLEEFYTLSDSSHSQDSGQPSPRCPSGNTNPGSNKEDPCSSPLRKMPTPQSSDESTKEANVQEVEPKLSVPETGKMPPSKNTLAPEIALSSPSPTSEVSAVSESSLKKRMAENLSRNGCSPFKNGEWSSSPRGKRVVSPRKPLANLTIVTGSEQEQCASQSLTPKAASRTKAASLTERANTMFISKSTADQFYLPREPSIVTKQCVSLMDLENLRSGTVFDVGDDMGFSKAQGPINPGSSGSSSRMDMLFSPGQEGELMDSWGHRTRHNQTMISASDTPSTMLRSTRMQEMGFDGGESAIGQKRMAQIAQQSVLFNTPSPNLGSSRTEDFPLNIPFARSRTMFGASQRGGSKYYRKPGFSRTTRPKLPKPAYLPPTRNATFVGTFPNGANERQADFSKQKSSTGLEITSTSARLRGIQSQPEPQPAGSLSRQRDGAPRRAVHTSAGTWRSRQNTCLTKPLLKDSAGAFPRSNTMMGKSSFESDSVLMIGRKDIPQPSKPGVEQLRGGGHSLRPYQNTLATRSELNLRVNKKS